MKNFYSTAFCKCNGKFAYDNVNSEKIALKAKNRKFLQSVA